MHDKGLITTIKKRRESLHVTQETLSELSEVSIRTIKQFESGKRKSNPKNHAKIIRCSWP